MPLSQGDVSWITAPGVIGKKLFLKSYLLLGESFDPYWIQMKITANLRQVIVNINEDGLVAAL
jgi:hypothetical protein